MTTETQAPEATQKWEVRTPVPDYNGVTLGQVFEHGKTVVEDFEIAQALQEDFGYIVTPPIPVPAVRRNYPDGDPRDRAPRPLHPIEDAPGRVAPFYPREASLPPGADPNVAIPRQSLEVHDEDEEETANEGNGNGEGQEGSQP